MKKQISKISIFQTSKIMTLMYVIFSLLYIPFGIGMLIFGGDAMKIMGIIYIAMPIIMGVFGFIFIVIGAWFYNLLASWVGGVEFEVTDIETA